MHSKVCHWWQIDHWYATLKKCFTVLFLDFFSPPIGNMGNGHARWCYLVFAIKFFLHIGFPPPQKRESEFCQHRLASNGMQFRPAQEKISFAICCSNFRESACPTPRLSSRQRRKRREKMWEKLVRRWTKIAFSLFLL